MKVKITKEYIEESERFFTRKEFCKELRNDETVSDIADTLIRILNFEFGGYNDG